MLCQCGLVATCQLDELVLCANCWRKAFVKYMKSKFGIEQTLLKYVGQCGHELIKVTMGRGTSKTNRYECRQCGTWAKRDKIEEVELDVAIGVMPMVGKKA